MFRKPFYLIIAVVTIVVGVAIFTYHPISQVHTKWVEENVISFNELGRNPIGLAIKGNNLVVLTRQSDLKKPRSLDSIYIYTHNGKTWLQQAELTIPEEKPREGYGYALSKKTAIDGDTILIGANIFTRSGDNWSLTTKLQPPSFDNLGMGKSIALDGDTAVIGTENATHVYRRNPDTGDWFFEAEVIRGPRLGIDFRPGKVDIDGDRIVDGFRVYRRNSNNDWLLEAELTLNGKPIRDILNPRISGNTIVLGMYTLFTAKDGRGTAHVFERNPNTGVWEYKTKLVPHDIVPSAIYGFGASIAIDDSTIIAGHGFDVRNNLAWALSWFKPKPKGRAYIFVRNKKGRWLYSAKLRPSNNQPTGGGVFISGNRVIISGKDDKKLYIFRRVD
ncbi:MAG: hypothetical protein AAFW70_18595 [Cyanobacteria bacterium J06635_10]